MRAVAVAMVLVVPALAAADVRAFTETYEYSTQPEGSTSVQLWQTARRINWKNDQPEEFQHRIEIEHGLSEHWDVGTSTYLAQSGRGGLVFDRVTLATRYRFVDRAEWPIDLLLALEAGKLVDASLYPIELRVVAARDFDRLTIAVNLAGRMSLGNDAEDTLEAALGWAGGASYQFHDKIRLGAETWGEIGDTRVVGHVAADVRSSAGPVLQFAPTAKFWAAGTVGFGLTDATEAFAVRVVLGIEL